MATTTTMPTRTPIQILAPAPLRRNWPGIGAAAGSPAVRGAKSRGEPEWRAGATLTCVSSAYFAETPAGGGTAAATATGTGFGAGAFLVNLARFVCSFLSGWIIWGSYAPEGQPAWLYSLLYNGGYMLPNALICTVVIVVLCMLVDPKTLRPMKLDKRKAA